MHKKRRKAYRNLINALLNCNEGEEWQLLEEHSELLDANFFQVMEQVAEELEKKGDEEGADFLWNLANTLVSASAYQEIIEQLLNCTSDEEALQILDANQDWVDTRLTQTMLEVAEDLKTQGDSENANFLMNLAEELMRVCGNTSDVQLNFLMQVLQATAESGGEAQVVYPLLQANIDKLNDKLAELLQTGATTALMEEEAGAAEYLAAVIVEFGNLIQQFPLGDKASNMEIAIAAYNAALRVYSHEAFPQQWAMTQICLGNAYCQRIRGERVENMENAIAACNAALRVHTREDTVGECATKHLT